ncbi:hypothetical protein EXS73_00540 [Candidatus Pacearchaeota archaeon]|nr:hypothetical protein [Candidatus Pacearchaeota archaeon]
MALGKKASHRLHHQYLLFASSDVHHVEQGLLEGIGLLGWMRAQPVFEKIKQQVVVACHPRMMKDIRAAALLCSPPLAILSVSGTLAGLGRNQ